MSKTITATNIDGGNETRSVQFPDECPVCHRNVAPTMIYAAITSESLRRELQLVFRCTSLRCDSVFIGIYTLSSNGTTDLERTTPKTPINRSFEDTICKLSPAFVIIYNQAIAAEAFSLDQVVGIGLRKALEFLIKDFAITQFPAKESAVKKSLLSNVINTYVKDENLKKVAERAAWLGNDETHYERIWDEQDLNDLKRLIHLSVNWIDNVLTSQEYIENMPKKEKNDN